MSAPPPSAAGLPAAGGQGAERCGRARSRAHASASNAARRFFFRRVARFSDLPEMRIIVAEPVAGAHQCGVLAVGGERDDHPQRERERGPVCVEV